MSISSLSTKISNYRLYLCGEGEIRTHEPCDYVFSKDAGITTPYPSVYASWSYELLSLAPASSLCGTNTLTGLLVMGRQLQSTRLDYPGRAILHIASHCPSVLFRHHHYLFGILTEGTSSCWGWYLAVSFHSVSSTNCLGCSCCSIDAYDGGSNCVL